MMLEAETGEVWQRLHSENGQCPRVHEVRPQGEYTGWDFKLVTLHSKTLQPNIMRLKCVIAGVGTFSNPVTISEQHVRISDSFMKNCNYNINLWCR